MLISLLVFLAFMPLIVVIALIESARAEKYKKTWQAEHIDVAYRKPSPFEESNNAFIRAVNKFVVNNVKDRVLDIDVAGTMFSNVVTAYVVTDKGNKTLRLFKKHTQDGWQFFEELTEEDTTPEDDSPKGETFNEDDFSILENI